jgi:Fe-S oxidoreductase
MSQALFILLLAVSIFIFARKVIQRLAPLRKKTLQIPPNPVRKFFKTLLEVGLQIRVVRHRPLAGLMHASVMFGFVVFAWTTIRHSWAGLTGFRYVTATHTWYEHLTAVFAVLTLIGILGLTYRRFILRPKVLGKLSPTSGVVAFLIAALMVTYLLGYSYYPVRSRAWVVNWWAHTFSLCAILAVIPFSKHLHLVLAPFTIFFRGDHTSQMRALDLEKEEFGLIHFSELTGKDILDVNSCVECGRCTDACPENATGHVLNPKEVILKMQEGLLAGGDMIAGDQEGVAKAEAWVTDEEIFECLSCGGCEQVCPVGIEHVGMKILDLRRGMVSEERVRIEKVQKTFAKMAKSPHNPWGLPQDARRKFLEDEKFPVFDGSQEWLFWLGCADSYDPHGQKVSLAMKKILDAAGISYGVLEMETCCGEPARRLGNEAMFMELSQKLIQVFSQKKVRKIVTCCPHGTTTFDHDYRQIPEFNELKIEVVHHTHLLERILPKLVLKRDAQTVTFHDSCYMARGRGVVREPRRILAACGIGIRELKRRGKDTFCCGAGGGQLFVADETKEQVGNRINDVRFRDVLSSGANTVVVECPFCPIMLKDAADQVNSEVQSLDIAEIIAERIESSTPGTKS